LGQVAKACTSACSYLVLLRGVVPGVRQALRDTELGPILFVTLLIAAAGVAAYLLFRQALGRF